MITGPVDPVVGGLMVVGGVAAAVFGGVWHWYWNHGPGALKDCPNCLGVKTYRRTSSQSLAAIGTGVPKGQRQQVIETFFCANCGHSVTKNRLETTQQSGELGPRGAARMPRSKP